MWNSRVDYHSSHDITNLKDQTIKWNLDVQFVAQSSQRQDSLVSSSFITRTFTHCLTRLPSTDLGRQTLGKQVTTFIYYLELIENERIGFLWPVFLWCDGSHSWCCDCLCYEWSYGQEAFFTYVLLCCVLERLDLIFNVCRSLGVCR